MVVRNFLGKDFFSGWTPTGRKWRFVGVWPVLAHFQVLGAKTGQNTTKSPFPTGQGPTGKKIVPEKVAENHPE